MEENIQNPIKSFHDDTIQPTNSEMIPSRQLRQHRQWQKKKRKHKRISLIINKNKFLPERLANKCLSFIYSLQKLNVFMEILSLDETNPLEAIIHKLLNSGYNSIFLFGCEVYYLFKNHPWARAGNGTYHQLNILKAKEYLSSELNNFLSTFNIDLNPAKLEDYTGNMRNILQKYTAALNIEEETDLELINVLAKRESPEQHKANYSSYSSLGIPMHNGRAHIQKTSISPMHPIIYHRLGNSYPKIGNLIHINGNGSNSNGNEVLEGSRGIEESINIKEGSKYGDINSLMWAKEKGENLNRGANNRSYNINVCKMEEGMKKYNVGNGESKYNSYKQGVEKEGIFLESKRSTNVVRSSPELRVNMPLHTGNGCEIGYGESRDRHSLISCSEINKDPQLLADHPQSNMDIATSHSRIPQYMIPHLPYQRKHLHYIKNNYNLYPDTPLLVPPSPHNSTTVPPAPQAPLNVSYINAKY